MRKFEERKKSIIIKFKINIFLVENMKSYIY